MKKDVSPGQHVISREPFPASRKIFVKGELHDIRVAMREIMLHATQDTFNHTVTPNAPVTVYDTSSPYTNPSVDIDVREGIPRIRAEWHLETGDTEQWPSVSLAYEQ